MRVRNAVIACVLGIVSASSALAQGGRRGLPPGAPADAPLVSPAEIQRMFDSYALMQAQEQLKIGDDKFPQFLTRFKALQDARRRGQQRRQRDRARERSHHGLNYRVSR